eukprot:TRINITY_DN303_c0_g3_i2.p1 TRINITY_DN303_c0_g3~~TRINITY_DN303_c0_g3_i2.p1  ORF type:complete len:397 (+),score=177.56 TRINITY_DN303_c0_g3_i2:138-1328(+)
MEVFDIINPKNSSATTNSTANNINNKSNSNSNSNNYFEEENIFNMDFKENDSLLINSSKEHFENDNRKINHLSSLRLYLKEFIGTFILTMLVNGATIQGSLSSPTFNLVSGSLGAGFGVFIATYTTCLDQSTSLNPAVLFSRIILGLLDPNRGYKLEHKKQFLYIFLEFCLMSLIQITASFAGAAAAYAIYYDAICFWVGGDQIPQLSQLSQFTHHSLNVINERIHCNDTKLYTLKVASLFACFPQSYSTFVTSSFEIFYSSALLIYIILVYIHIARIVPSFGPFVPLILGLSVACIELSLSANAGGSNNPAKDLGARMFLSAAGWSVDVWDNPSSWWAIAFFVPFAGAIFATMIYIITFGFLPKGDLHKPLARVLHEQHLRFKRSNLDHCLSISD